MIHGQKPAQEQSQQDEDLLKVIDHLNDTCREGSAIADALSVGPTDELCQESARKLAQMMRERFDIVHDLGCQLWERAKQK